MRCTSNGTGIDAFFDLGPGNDTLVVHASGQAVGTNVVADGPGKDTVSLDTGRNRWLNGPGNDTYGGGRLDDRTRPGLGLGNDVIYGRGGNDRLAGGSGNDVMYGRGGKDRLAGGSGNDVMYGRGGKDRLAGGVTTTGSLEGLATT